MKTIFTPEKPRPIWLTMIVLLCMAMSLVFMVTSVIAYLGLTSQLAIDAEMIEYGMEEDLVRYFITSQLILFRLILVPAMLILISGLVLMLLRRKLGFYLYMITELIPVLAFIVFVIPQQGRLAQDTEKEVFSMMDVIFYLVIPVLFATLFFFFRKSFFRKKVETLSE
ncbi:MAG: hypothetical protein V2A54_10340 [Bacteroidota bacterium]